MKINVQFMCKSAEEVMFIENMITKWIDKAKYSQCYTVLRFEDRVDVTFDDTELERMTAKELANHELSDLIKIVYRML